jgi:BirA family biotin operon repressor/biotin-[acetyl-CoA-carboxylase] ligase
LGRALIARAEVGSTNDEAWDALSAGAPDGVAIVADVQHRGRGRAGRSWHTAPGKGLALSLLLHRDCERRPLGLLPLAGGLALARAFDALGVPVRLEWPNDLLLGSGKLAGILAETRALASGGPPARRAAVVGVGVNVAQRASDFPPELSGVATSLATEGFAVGREVVAAEFLNALEPLWEALGEQGAGSVVTAWTARASFWGEEVRAHTPAGTMTGIARALDPDGGLVLELPDGARARILAGDVRPAPR